MPRPLLLWLLAASCAEPPPAPAPSDPAPAIRLVAVDDASFEDTGAQPNAWADFDNDGDLDLYVGFRGRPNRLYRNDGDGFTDVAPELGLALEQDTRVASWGDYDADGHVDLYLGFPAAEETGNRLYRNLGDGSGFEDVAAAHGMDLIGQSRQSSFVDYDGDGDVDLFAAFRDQPNRLFRNDGGSFTEVAESVGLADPRKTVGVVWFDLDEDGDLDAFVANQNGDADGAFLQEDGRFRDAAVELGLDGGPRTVEYGGVGPAVTDFDNDGDLDLFVANYGPDTLYRNDGGGRFVEVGHDTPLGADHHSTTAAWGDVDNDGWSDLFVAAYLREEAQAPDHLFRNIDGRFVDETPDAILAAGASHGVQWADFDDDGDLDLALDNNHPEASHPLYENLLDAGRATRSIKVWALDAAGRATLAGAEVRFFDADGGAVLGARLVDSGGGYCSQNAMPVHFGVPEGVEAVDVELTFFTPSGRQTVRRDGLRPAPGAVEIRAER